MKRDELVAYLDDLLSIREYEDYGPQGLQVEGRPEVDKVTLSVDAALPALEAAAAAGSHFHLVHHGLFWGEPQRLVGPKGRQVQTLIKADVNLYAAHLALDAHPEVGNNAVLAGRLGLEIEEWWAEVKGRPVGVWGRFPAGLELGELLLRVEKTLGVRARVSAFGPRVVDRLGVVTGGAADEIVEAARLGIDTFLTGEASHSHYWDAAACGINVIYGGHYATETVGVRALGERLGAEFGLEVVWLDFPTGL